MNVVKSYICLNLFALLGLSTLLLSSCQKDNIGRSGEGEGSLQLSLKTDPTVMKVTRGGETEDPIYRVEIINSLDMVVATYENHTEMPESIRLDVGSYTIRATSGNNSEAAFDAPYYVAQGSALIKRGESSTLALTGKLSNVKVSVNFSDVIFANFSSYRVQISNEQEGGELLFDQSESKMGYFKNSGILTYTITLVNNQGTEFKAVRSIRNVEPRQYHILNITVDTEGDLSHGGLNGGIKVDESLNEYQHTINVVLTKKSKPVIEGDGFNMSYPVYVQYQVPVDACLVKIQSEGRLHDVVLTHEHPELVDCGLPNSISLANIDAELKSELETLGLTWNPQMIEDAKLFELDFAALTQSLPTGDYKILIEATDQQDLKVSREIRFIVSPDEVLVTSVAPWAKFATLTGRWETEERPAGLGFMYKKSDASDWTVVSESELVIDEEHSTFSARITALEANSSYVVKALTESQEGSVVTDFSTETAAQILNMSFDAWSKGDKDVWMPNVNQNGDNYCWDSGNTGASTLGTKNPTSPEYSYVAVSGEGKAAAKLKPMFIGIGSLGAFASGSIYTGKFGAVQGTSGATLNFGVPYESRPLRMTGYYSYTPGTIDYAKAPYTALKGTTDQCQIYVILTDWNGPFQINTSTGTFIDLVNDSKIIAYGELTAGQPTDGYEPFTIRLDYRDLTRKPKYAVIVASSCKYGDYFTGSTGSVMYIDEFEFEFDPE